MPPVRRARHLHESRRPELGPAPRGLSTRPYARGEPSASGGKLERTLGLRESLAIGVGTMVGAGIFIFPGLAAGRAGPAATLSFAIGAAIALLIALPTSELATAMPETGGGYHYVSRALGPLAGFVVGIGQWFGLVFASAFYLVGFSHYVASIAGGLGMPLGVGWIALVTTMALTAVNVSGTRKSGRLQNRIVAALLILLAGFLGHGIAQATGLLGPGRLPETFAPFGVFPIFTTAALVFTSYLGFELVAAVGGEIERPERTLPRALVGSVLLVGTLYVGAVFVSTSAFGSRRLAELGETALVEVGRSFLGTPGAVAITAAGLLATLSSANASILSCSRALFALARDDLVSRRAAAVNRRYRTPHVALFATALPVAALVTAGSVELLAEVASHLHLFMFALMCGALLRLRRRMPEWYRPSFRAPGGPAVPALGAAASVGLMLLMRPLAQAIGAAILAGAALWRLGRRRRMRAALDEGPDGEVSR